MRRIDEPGAIPDSIDYNSIKSKVNDLVENGKISGYIYRGGKEAKVSKALAVKYKNKCGYCERQWSDPDVEHHRPKGKTNTGTEELEGYHWLAYEWSNMVATCSQCNESPHKGIQFPVAGKVKNGVPRNDDGKFDISSFKYESDYLKQEQPLLLHPEYCEPKKHFRFNRSGEIIGRTVRGKVSAQVYGLKHRDLNVLRKKVYEEYSARIQRAIQKFYEKDKSHDWLEEEIEDEFKLMMLRYFDVEAEFTLFTYWMTEDFEHFFIEPFDVSVHKLLKQTYLNVFEEMLDLSIKR
jgi:5-methylcytosine-specific restriction endonuclease McrA